MQWVLEYDPTGFTEPMVNISSVSGFSNITLVAGNHPDYEYLYHGNWQALQISPLTHRTSCTFSSTQLVVYNNAPSQ